MQAMYDIFMTIALAIVEIICSESVRVATVLQPFSFTAIKVNISFLTALLLACIAFIICIGIAISISVFMGLVLVFLPKLLVLMAGLLFAFFMTIFAKNFLNSFQEAQARIASQSALKGSCIEESTLFSLNNLPARLEGAKQLTKEEAQDILERQSIAQIRTLIEQLNITRDNPIEIFRNNTKSQLIKKILANL
jgi:hypothetical protein